MNETGPDNPADGVNQPPGSGRDLTREEGRTRVSPPRQASATEEDKFFRLKLSIFWGGVIAAIIAAVAVGIPGWQDFIAQEEAKQQLRAYIDVRAKGMPAIEEGLKPRANDSFHNIGRTPAYDNGSSAHVTVAEYPLTRTLASEDCQQPSPSSTKNKWFVGKVKRPETVRESPLTAQEVQAIKDGKAAVYFHGRVCYRDIFSESHRTDFCTYWKWTAGQVSPGLYCEKGNSAD